MGRLAVEGRIGKSTSNTMVEEANPRWCCPHGWGMGCRVWDNTVARPGGRRA